jgi:hypothetical protein
MVAAGEHLPMAEVVEGGLAASAEAVVVARVASVAVVTRPLPAAVVVTAAAAEAITVDVNNQSF